MPTTLTYGVLYLEINLFALLLLVIIRVRTQGISKMVAQRNFAMAVDGEVLCILSDALCMLIRSGILPAPPWVLLAMKTVYFFSTTLMCFFWFLYFEHMQASPFVGNRRRVMELSALVWVMGVLLAVNWFTGILFSVDETGAYQRGPLFALQYLLAYAYVFVTCTRAWVKSFRREHYARRRNLRLLALFPVGPAIAGVVQFIYPQLPLACVALSAETLALYLAWVDQMISVDPLTHLNNRKQLAYSFDQWAAGDGEGRVTLLLLDANKFKHINDEYGHLQGDAALVRIADALRLGCKGARHRARYGGDEFVVLAWEEDPQELEALCRRVRENLAQLNAKAEAPYDLTVSIGMARARPGQSLSSLIEAADQELYREKARLRQGA